MNASFPSNAQQTLPEVAVVVLNWNGRGFLEKFLPYLVASTYTNKRIIVADNASIDDSVPFVRQNFPDIEIIENPFNYGFAKGYNAALRKINSDYYVLLNSDVEVTPGWIEPIIALMETDALIAACQPKILDHKIRDQFEYAGACGGWIDNFGYPFTRGRVFETCEKDLGQYDSVQQCFWASGAALFIKAKCYHEMGGMDEFFFAHQEEIDLCWRLQRSGYKIFVQPLSVVYHVGGGTLPKGNNRKTFLNFRNNLVMLHKNLPSLTALWKIPVRLMLDAVAAWRALFSGDSGFFVAVCRSHVQYVRWIFFEKTHRSKTNRQYALAGKYDGVVIWDHFIRGKKTFSEIVRKADHAMRKSFKE